MHADPIFIHAWWRSGSTYVWSKLRENEALVCYYEPLHDRIAHLDLETIAQPHPLEKSHSLRHPPQKKHYYAEYAPLLRSNSLGFSPALSYDRFLLRPEEVDEQLRVYIHGLIRSASALERRPTLCFCRSQMRSAWMKKNFGGFHIAQIRNPVDQWASLNYGRGPYFIDKMLEVALKLHNLHPRAFAHIEASRLVGAMASRLSMPMDELGTLFLKQKDIFAVFLLIWIASALQAISFSDFVLDIDRLSTDLEYKIAASDWFAGIGCPTDFSDCASPSSGELSAELEQVLGEAVNAIRSNASTLVIADASVIAKRLYSLSTLSAKILHSVL